MLCHALVTIDLSLRKTNMASKTPRKKIADRQKNGKFISVTEKGRRDTGFRHCKSFIMETDDKKVDLERGKSFSAELSWDEGRRVVELRVLAEGLWACN